MADEFAGDSYLQSFERAAIKASGNSSWRPWIFRKVDNGILCTGAVCPPITRGPRKGEPNFRKHDKVTKSTVLVPCIAPLKAAPTNAR